MGKKDRKNIDRVVVEKKKKLKRERKREKREYG
jgi:hypothetical protein